ncbi:MAG: hypothetical protein WCY08_14400 [Rhodocyclaceae bacterium]
MWLIFMELGIVLVLLLIVGWALRSGRSAEQSDASKERQADD